jgi:uncharacterized protein
MMEECAANKVGDRLSPAQREWLAHSPLGFVATTDACGVLLRSQPPQILY